jgi:hypothetical protein
MVTFLLRESCAIKQGTIAGGTTASYGEELLMNALQTLCFELITEENRWKRDVRKTYRKIILTL